MTYSARDIIGTHAWIDHQDKVSRKTRYDGRDWENCDTKNCCGLTKKGCIVVTGAVGGATIGAIVGAAVVGTPTGGLGCIPGAIIGAIIGGVIGEFIEKCEKNKL